MKFSKNYKILLFILVLAIFVSQAVIFRKNYNELIGFAGVNFIPDNISRPKIYFIDVTQPYKAMFLLEGNEPKIVFLSGTIILPNKVTPQIHVGSNTTLIGVGKNAKILDSGLKISGAHNIIIKNIEFTNAPNDAITIEKGSHHIWIDHCVFSHAFDGLCDIVTGSDYVTLSWNVFERHWKTILIGGSNKTEDIDKNHLHVTIHHNYFKECRTRLPRVRFGKVHVFNNYYESNITGIRSTNQAEVLSENNFFYNVKVPATIGFENKYLGALKEKGDICFWCQTKVRFKDKVFNPKDYYNYSLNNALFVPLIVKCKAGLL